MKRAKVENLDLNEGFLALISVYVSKYSKLQKIIKGPLQDGDVGYVLTRLLPVLKPPFGGAVVEQAEKLLADAHELADGRKIIGATWSCVGDDGRFRLVLSVVFRAEHEPEEKPNEDLPRDG